MDFKATIANGYRNRLILIAAGALLYAAWALYDANIGYPNKLTEFETYRQTQDENPDDWKEIWVGLARENGWDDQPEELSANDIATQWVLFGVTFPIGVYCLYALIIWSRRFVGVDGEKVYAHGNVEVPFDNVYKVDATRWENKGIAHVRYDIGSGEKTIVIDDWKYNRELSDQIFQRLRENLPADRFIGLTEGVTSEV